MARKKGSGKTIGMTQISISLPQTLVEQIDKMAESHLNNAVSTIIELINECCND